MSEETFGRRARETSAAADLIDLEQREGRAEDFAAIDVVMSGLVVRAMRGERVVQLARTERGDVLRLVNVPESLRDALQHAFQLETQQSRGAWFLAETVSVKARAILFPLLFREAPRYAHTLAADEKAKLALSGNPDAMVAWSVLEPFCELLLSPIFLRVDESGFLERDAFVEQWNEVARAYNELLPGVSAELAPYAWGGGWARLAPEQQLAAKGALLNALVGHVDAGTVRRYRARVTKTLIAQYYAKAKNGRAKRKQVITKDYARGLAAFFGGDWLAFVRYLGEEPHDEERIVTALPEPRLIVGGGKAKAVELAAKKGVPVEEAERILQALWNDMGGNSPVLERVAVLASYWRSFDEIHARQQSGMPPLWGLVEDGGWAALETRSDAPYQPMLYRRLLAPPLITQIEQLWRTTVLSKSLDCVVSEPFPHSAMAETFGPALKFWHGCALTAWFICEGPTSRTDIPGLAKYYARELAALEDLGCPVQPQLFEQLKQVRLGPEEAIYKGNDSIDVGYGLSLQIQMSGGTRRKGFELLRGVITQHRRWWASQYLERYLRVLWERELKAVARQFHLISEEKGKPPTLKQFAKHVVEPARRWFGGDVGLLYTSIGQKLGNIAIRRSLRMPSDRVSFVERVFNALGGFPFDDRSIPRTPEDAKQHAAMRDRHHALRRLAAESLTYVQLAEAQERAPTLKEFGPRFEWPSKALDSNVEVAWATFSTTIDRVLREAGAPLEPAGTSTHAP